MFRRLTQSPIRLRLPIMIVSALMTTIIAMSVLSYIDFRKGVEEHVAKLSITVGERSVASVEGWISELTEEVAALAKDRSSEELLQRLDWTLTGAAAPTLNDLRSNYIDRNPFPLGQREQFDQSPDGSVYDLIHVEFHDQFRGITARSGYYDLFFISPNGDVVYSVYKEDDFGTNLVNGRYSTSGLADVFRMALEDPGGIAFSDFAPYAPSSGAPASFMAEAVLNDAGQTIGVVAIQLPIQSLQANLTASSILGPQDETYLLGADRLARTGSIEDGFLAVLDQAPALPHLEFDTAKTSLHFNDVIGLRGNHVDAHVVNFDVLGNIWTVVVERDLDAAFAPLTAFVWKVILVFVVGAVLSVLISYFLAKSVTRPLVDFSDAMRRVGDGDLDAEVTGLDRHDEFGHVATNLNDFREKLKEAQVLAERDAMKGDEQALVVKTLGNGLNELAKGNLNNSLNDPFSSEYEELRQNFNATVETMNDLMRTIVDNSNEIHARAEEISASSDDLSHRTENQAATLEETAAALDELTASVREAAESASEVENVVTDARKDAEESGVVVSEAVNAMSMIRKSSSEISQIIGVIDDIAFQTNLLSLNASVEAARAGEAGRGFAVVASEVRALAQRSSEAAKQIKSLITSSSEQVETGVGLVGRTGEALGSIIERVGNIDALVSGIASGSREQSSGLGEINIGMTQLDQVTQQNAAMVEEATAAATTLRTEAAGLTHLVGRFKLKNAGGSSPNMDSVIDFKASSIRLMEDAEQPQAVYDDEQPQAVDDAEQPQAVDGDTIKQAVNANGWTDF